MEKAYYSNTPLRMMLLLTGILLSIAVYSPGYCLDPPVITPLDEFFIEHNGGDVQIAPPDWKLIVDGLVEQPLALTIDDILEYPAQTHMATIECGGNPFAFKVADLIGNAVWTGVPVRTILEHAGLLDNAASVVFTALDGYSNRISLDDIYQRDNIMLAYGMNGETLPPEQGYPIRLTFPGIAGSNWVQWVTHVEVTSKEQTSLLPYALPPHCQIFTPTSEQTINLGDQRIYGMALAGDVEIVAVEVSTDGGASWQAATILTEYVPHTWRHWEFNWTPPAPGNYTISARAINSTGAVQGEPGIYGWKMLSIEVTAEGPDACVYGAPCAEGKYCDESADQCVECLNNGHCPSGDECINGACVEADQPPVFLSEPLWVGPWMGLSSDPANPHKPQSKHILFWAYDDDRLACPGGAELSWMYRPVELQDGVVVPLGDDWVVKEPWRFLWYAWIEAPSIAEITSPGLFEFKMTATDCLDQEIDSEGFWGKRYYFQVD